MRIRQSIVIIWYSCAFDAGLSFGVMIDAISLKGESFEAWRIIRIKGST